MALLATPNALLGLAGATQGTLPPTSYHAALWGLASDLWATSRDWRVTTPTDGTIAANNRVTYKASDSTPEVPFAGARVRVYRLTDGFLAWQGTSDAQGWYHPRGLEVGEKYYPIAIDLSGQYECTAAGPVVATLQS